MASTQVEILITAKDQASKTIQKAEGSLSKFTSIIKPFGLAAVAAAGAAAAGFAAFGVSSVKAFAEAEASQKRFETSMKNIAKASDDEVAALRRQQSALQNVTRFEDDAIASGQGFLATFQLNAKQIEHLTPKLLDMAEGLRDVNGQTIGLEQASNMLGKAIQLGTVGMLAKAGVTIPGTTKAMQDLFKKNFELANIQERVIMVGELLEGNFKGQAEAAGNTLAGKMTILKNRFGDAKESFGQALTQIIPLTGAFDLLNTALAPEKVQGYIDQFSRIVGYFQAARDAVRGFFSETNVVWNFLTTLFGPSFEIIKTAALDAWAQITEALKPIMPVLEMFVKILGVTLIAALAVVVRVAAETFKIIANVIATTVTVTAGVINILTKLFTAFFGWIPGATEKAVAGFKSAWESVTGFLKNLFNGIAGMWNKSIGKISISVPDWVPKIGGNSFTAPKIPTLQYGGGAYANRAALVGEHRPEVFVPHQSGNVRQLSETGSREITINFNNANVRNDRDLDSIVDTIKKTLAREQELTQMGAI